MRENLEKVIQKKKEQKQRTKIKALLYALSRVLPLCIQSLNSHQGQWDTAWFHDSTK